MFFSTLFKTAIVLTFVVTFHAILAWILLLQPKQVPTPVKPHSVQISFIQLQKSVQKPVVERKNVPKIAQTIAKTPAPKPVKKTEKINKTPKRTKPKPKKIKAYKPKKEVKNEKVTKKTIPQLSHTRNVAKIAISKTNPQTNQNSQINQTSNTEKTEKTEKITSNRPVQLTTAKKIKPRFNQAYLYQPKPPYTRILKRLNLQGTVKLRIIFAKQGHVEQVQVINSSGSTRLDNHALQYIKKHWQYNAPEKRQWTTVIPIRFYLQ